MNGTGSIAPVQGTAFEPVLNPDQLTFFIDRGVAGMKKKEVTEQPQQHNACREPGDLLEGSGGHLLRLTLSAHFMGWLPTGEVSGSRMNSSPFLSFSDFTSSSGKGRV